MARHYKLFDKALKHSSDKKNKLVVVSEIPVYKEEFNYIKQLNIHDNYKKVLFAFLIQNKLNKEVYKIRKEKELNNIYYKGNSKQYNELKKMAKIPQKIKLHEEVIYELSKQGLINPMYQGLIQLKFLGLIDKVSDVMFYIRNYEETGWYFDYYNSAKKIKLCSECGEPFRQSNNRQEYCNRHSPAVYTPMETKKIVCIDCGKEVKVDAKANNIKRCEECFKRERQRINQEYYKKIKTDQFKLENAQSIDKH